MTLQREAFQGPIFHFIEENRYEYFEDGVLVVEGGKIVSLGDAQEQLPLLPKNVVVHTYGKNRLIVPGFIDTHTHFPQIGMVASFGKHLLDWLTTYTFPHEKRFLDKDYAAKMAPLFIEEMLRNGTTSALVFTAAPRCSLEALFEEGNSRNMRVIAGNALGDRNLPDYHMKSVDATFREAKDLIHTWHGVGRLHYALSPRFAPSSSEEQLSMMKNLLDDHPDIYFHTHLSENVDEVAWVKQLFPWSANYLDVYHHFGLVRSRSIFAHAIHISDEEMNILAASKAAVSFCPTSNLFLGSGLFKWRRCKKAGVSIGVGTDIGAGTSFSLLSTIGEGYKVAQLQHDAITPMEAFYHLTLGGARALSIDNHVGNFTKGKEADFVVLDLCPTPLMTLRMEETTSLAERLFLLMMLGDDRNICETHLMGKVAYNRL